MPVTVQPGANPGTKLLLVAASGSQPEVCGSVVCNPDGTSISGSGSGTGNVNLTQVGGAAIALGQALAAASLPVVLTAAQLATLTTVGGLAAENAVPVGNPVFTAGIAQAYNTTPNWTLGDIAGFRFEQVTGGLMCYTRLLTTADAVTATLAGVSRAPAAVAATAGATIAAGSKSITFISSSDWAGTILGVTFPASSTFTLNAPAGDTIGAVVFTRSAGTLTYYTLT